MAVGNRIVAFVLGGLLGALVAAAPLAAARAHPRQPREAEIDRLFAEWSARDTPGCTLGVGHNGGLVFAKGYGMASLTYGVANGPETVFPIGSNSKQFTAMLIALLAEEGKLGLDDDIRKWLPELPDYGHVVRIRHLIHHTGGLRDYQALRYLSGVAPEHLDAAETLALVARQRAPNAPPGTRFAYDNTGFVLLRFIAERAAGMPFAELARQRLFAPLGMDHTTWTEDYLRVVPNLATPYVGDRREGFAARWTAPIMGSGGVLTTIADLLRWDETFYANRLGKRDPALVARAVTPGTLDDGTPLAYGYGVFLDSYRGRRIVWHAGHGPGYVADLVRFPAEHLAVFCLCNGDIDSRLLSRRVADLFLPPAGASGSADATRPAAPAAAGATIAGVSPPPVATPQPLSPPAPAELANAAGDYLAPRTGDVWHFAIEPRGLVLHVGTTRMELVRTGAGRFHSQHPDRGWDFEFPDVVAAPATRVRLTDQGEVFVCDRLPAPPPAATLAAFAGRYDCDELRNPYTIALAGDRLVLDTALQPKGSLLYLGPDRFLVPGEWFTLELRFSRAASGAVTGFTLDAGPANGFRFERLAER